MSEPADADPLLLAFAYASALDAATGLGEQVRAIEREGQCAARMAEWSKLELDRREQSDRAARLRAAMLGAIQRMEPLSDDLDLGGVAVAPVAAIRALAQIHKLMRSADEWNADTLDDIAAVFGGLGAHPGR